MKQSRFNVIDKGNQPTLAYNSYSGAIVALDAEYEKGLFENGANCPSEIVDNLTDAGLLVPDGLDEIEHLKEISLACRMQSKSLSFTIAPTLNCNFRCPYCYENGKRYGSMSDRCVDQVIKHINGMVIDNQAESLQIAWYGGEPLLAIETVEKITRGIRSDEILFNASMVTNGYFLDGKTAELLAKNGVTHVQVTVDGPPEIHNRRRCLPSGGDTFNRIIDNVKRASAYFDVILRVNVDPSNGDQIDRLVDSLDRKGLRNKVKLYLAAVDDINGTCANSPCYSEDEFASIEASCLSRYKMTGYMDPFLPGFNPTIC